MLKKYLVLGLFFILSGCASQWKVQGGPKACKKMCSDWDLEFTAMVGVGNQDKGTAEGATACVCQPKNLMKQASISGASSSSASLAGPIVAAAQAAAAAAAQQQAMAAQAAQRR